MMIKFISQVLCKPEKASAPAPDDDDNTVDALLLEYSEKSYLREIDESEAVWRSLPLFPVTFGFAVALIGYALASAPRSPESAFDWSVYGLIVVSAAPFLPAFRWLWKTVRPKRFRYLPTDLEILDYARSLREHYASIGSDQSMLDKQVTKHLRSYLLQEWAAAATHNQAHNQSRSQARGRAIFYLMICIALALFTNATILVGSKFTVVGTTVMAREQISPPVSPSTRPAPATTRTPPSPPRPQYIDEGVIPPFRDNRSKAR